MKDCWRLTGAAKQPKVMFSTSFAAKQPNSKSITSTKKSANHQPRHHAEDTREHVDDRTKTLLILPNASPP